MSAKDWPTGQNIKLLMTYGLDSLTRNGFVFTLRKIAEFFWRMRSVSCSILPFYDTNKVISCAFIFVSMRFPFYIILKTFLVFFIILSVNYNKQVIITKIKFVIIVSV